MNLNDLRTANFSKLDTAVTKWDEMVGKLERIADDMRTNVKGKADKANWKGVNSDVTRQFIGKTATEFDEMETQAKSIRNILRDTAGELRGYQKAVNDRIESEKDLHVTDLGDGKFQVEVRDDAPEGTDPEELKSFLESQLSKATTSDKSAADVLNSMMELNEKGFTNISYTDRDEAAEALADAGRAAELMNKNPHDLSPNEFDELLALTEDHHDDPLFAERFATTAGPRSVVEFWTGIHNARESSDLLDARLDKYDELQESLGLTLATATRSDSDAMARWGWEMADLGEEKVTVDGIQTNTRGFQAMSALMHWGDFDDDFLDTYGNQLIDAEKKLSHNGLLSDRNVWYDPTGAVGNLSHVEGDSGRDPFLGYMKALSNSPDAALEFFDDPFVTKDEDHDFEDGDGNKRSLTTFDYLFEEREWLTYRDSDGDEVNTGQDALGEALYAATTGHPADAAPSVETFPHSQEQADLFKNIVQSVSEDPNRLLEDGSVMSDSLGKMSAEYMPDIHRALNSDNANEARLFPVTGAVAEGDDMKQHVTSFLHTVGRDPDGYWAVNAGQHNYTTALIEYHFQNPDAYHPDDTSFSQADKLKEAIGEISSGAGTIQGTIGAGRTYEIELEGAERDAEYNGRLDNIKTWASTLAGAGVGIASAPYSGPGAIVAGEATKTGVNEVLDSVLGGMKQDSTQETIYDNGTRWSNYQKGTEDMAQQAVQNAGSLYGNSSSVIVSEAGDRVQEGFGFAQDNVHSFVDGQGVPGELG